MPNPAEPPCPHCKTVGQLFLERPDPWSPREAVCIVCGWRGEVLTQPPLPYVGNRPELDGHRGRKTR
jgi:hypothetical protein